LATLLLPKRSASKMLALLGYGSSRLGRIIHMKVWFLLLLVLAACTGSSEPEKDFQLVFGVANLPSSSGVLANCSNPLSVSGGLLRIDSRKLETVNPTGNCNFIATPSVPFNLERSLRVNAAENRALFVSLPKASQVRAYNSQLSTVIWTFPSATVPLPADWKDFCPTQLALSSSNTPVNSSPSENFLVVLDDPKDPKSDCNLSRDNARLLVLNRDGTRKGWLNLDFAARVNGQVRVVASETEIYLLYADNGTSYRVARLAFSSLVDDTKSSNLQFSEAIPIFSNLQTNLALAFTSTGLLAGIGGTNGKVIAITFKDNKIELGAELRESTETSDLIGSTQAIFWNRDNTTNNLSIFARERPDILLRRVATIPSKINRSFNTQYGIFTSDSSFWGISNNAFYRLDVFNFPNIQTLQGLTSVGDAKITALTWLIGN
jgi:hypothetical protein